MASAIERSWTKIALFAAVGAMAAFVLFNNERFFIDHLDPSWKYYRPVFGWLVPHGLMGALALASGVLQFSARLRARMPAVHRLIGRLYVVGVFIAALISLRITTVHNELPLRLTVYVQATLWMLATGIAFYCIRKRRFAEHREWMIRSYAITLIFLTSRVLDAIPSFGALDTATNPSGLWFCNVLAWVVPTLIIAWPKITGQQRAQR